MPRLQTRASFSLAMLLAACGVPEDGGGSLIQFSSIEGGLTEAEPVVIINVGRTGGAAGAVSARFATRDGTARAGVDYVEVEGTLAWADGEDAPKQIEIPLIDDGVSERLETFVLEISEPTGDCRLDPTSASAIEKRRMLRAADALPVGPEVMSAVLAIVDDDPASPLEGPSVLEIRGTSVERRSEGVFVDVAVARSGSARGEVSVAFETRGESAVAGTDFVHTEGTLRWGAGEANDMVASVPLRSDATAGRTFQFLLLEPKGDARLGATSSVTVTVPDPAGQPTAVATADVQVGEAPLEVVFDGSASHVSSGTIVRYEWSFGDGSTDEGVVVTHRYTEVGEYEAVLRVTSEGGATASTTLVIRVEASTSTPLPFELRINAGGSTVADAAGQEWSADRAYGSGATWGFENPPSDGFGTVDRRDSNPEIDVGGTADEAIFATERWGMTAYRADVPDGRYDVSLLFAETYAGVTGPDQRVFDVAMEGEVVAPYVDVFAAVGHTQAYIIVVPAVPVQDGRLDIEFIPIVQRPMINGIEILSSAAPTFIERQVASSLDDAEENLETSAIDATSTDLELGIYNNVPQLVGMRFTDLTIPPGAVIVSAHVQFQVDEVSTEDAELLLQAELTGDAAGFTTTSGDLSARSVSSTSVSWFPAPWMAAGDAGPDQRTPDVGVLIQEVIDQPGWAGGNDVVLFVTGTGTRIAEAFDGAAEAAPRLRVQYIAP